MEYSYDFNNVQHITDIVLYIDILLTILFGILLLKDYINDRNEYKNYIHMIKSRKC